MIKKFRVWLARQYENKPLFTKLFFGVDPESLTLSELRKRAYLNIVLFWVVAIIFILIWLGTRQLEAEIDLCMSGDLLSACIQNLNSCVMFQ